MGQIRHVHEAPKSAHSPVDPPYTRLTAGPAQVSKIKKQVLAGQHLEGPGENSGGTDSLSRDTDGVATGGGRQGRALSETPGSELICPPVKY